MPNLNQILKDIQRRTEEFDGKSRSAADAVRRQYLEQINGYHGRAVISYYSGFLTHSGPDVSLNDEDVVGLMAAIHNLDRDNGLDLILHTPGGGMGAAISIVNYLRKMFPTDIRAIVPHVSMSAGTMIACSCDSIIMAKHAQLGPIDPQMRGVAAAGVTEEFERACRECQENPSKIPMWQSIVGKYSPTFLSQCENAVTRSKEWVHGQLCDHMFKGEHEPERMATNVVEHLSSFTKNKGHDRPVFADECVEIGLKVQMLEDDQKFQDLVLSAHHCYMHAVMNGPITKMIENHKGASIVRQLRSR